MSSYNAFLKSSVLSAIRANWRRYAIALAAAVLAILVRAWFHPVLGEQGSVFFLAAILVSAWFGGIGPALFSLVLLHLVHGYGFSEPRRLWNPSVASIVSTLAYYLVGIMVGALSQMRSRAQRGEREHQLEAMSQREQLRATLSCMADGVLVTDIGGRITLMNPVAETMTGWHLNDSIGKPWKEVFAISRGENQNGAQRPIDRVLHERRVLHEKNPLVLTARTGQTTPITYSAAPVHDAAGRVMGVVVVFRDESERQRTELALRNADRRKDEFLATLAHELRNPLAPISMGLELLNQSADDPKIGQEVRSMMQRQTQHMVHLINDLLDVSRITRGKLELRKGHVELAEIVRNAVEATRPIIEEAGHRLTVRLPEKRSLLYADANRMTQVLTNLLNNAAKFTPREGSIELTAEHTGSEVTITVSDSGIGIPQDKIDSVFEMFAQINETSESGRTGLGIGLSLVKRLMELHGGSVEVFSSGRNLGSVFRVRLPALPEPPNSQNGTKNNGSTVSKKSNRRILVVDDNADALESLSRMVTIMGNDVRRARDGLEALEVGRSFHPDVVLMDLGMPNLNGYEAARRMRQEPWGRELALVATTGWGQEEDRRRTAEAGFDRHLVKPIELASLREVLDAPVGRMPG